MRIRRAAFAALVGLGVLSLGQLSAQEISIAGRAAKITIGGRFNAQYAVSSVDNTAAPFFIRRARIQVDFQAGDFVYGRIEPDFGRGTAVIADGFVRLNFDPAFQLYFGQFKRAFSGFELASSTDLPLIEREATIAGIDDCAGVHGVCSFSRLAEQLQFDNRDLGLRAEGTLGSKVVYVASLTGGEGQNVADVNSGKSPSAKIGFKVTPKLTISALAAAHDFRPVSTIDSTEYAPAYGGEVEWGTWRSGLHVMGVVVHGENWKIRPATGATGPFAAKDFTTGQGMISFFHPIGKPHISGIEPLVRVSWADPNTTTADDGATIVTPGVGLYFIGKNWIEANLDLYSPEGTRPSARSFKVQVFLFY
jgi:hypothetical protein